MKDVEQVDIRKSFLKPVEIALWMGIFGIPVFAWFMPLSSVERQSLLLLTAGAALFVYILFHHIMPQYGTRPWVNYLGVTGIIAMVAYCAYLLAPYSAHVEILFVAVIAGIGIMAGRRISLWTAIMAVAAQILIAIYRGPLTGSALAALGVQLLVLLLAGYLVSFLTGTIHEKVIRSDRQNRYLSTLLRAGDITLQTEDLASVFPQIAELVAREVPVTCCRICLVNTQEDLLTTYGLYPVRPLVGWDARACETHSLRALPWLKEALETGRHLIIQKAHAKSSPQGGTSEEFSELFFDGIQTVCLIPLVAKGKKLGMLFVGEARDWEREPFNQEKLDFLLTLATQISTMIHSSQVYQKSRRRAERLAVLNEVAKAIGSTIEMDDLLELIYQQLMKVIPSDTYYVSLYDAKEHTLEVRILIDDEQRFPPQTIPIGHGFASRVIESQHSLLVRNLLKQQDTLPIRPMEFGSNRMSESWLGVPMLISDRCLGLLAIASYTPDAFDDDDMALLSSVASQAALALDNASQHAEVKDRARRDSLTGVYNHGYLISRLEQEVEKGAEEGTPVTLIMIDIDHFKKYNDTYGHTTGDEVLRRLAQTIQAHVKSSDIVGRWGGEEFAIALPGATTAQAMQVAERIRASLAQMELIGKHNTRLPSPTVSQGIATFPDHTDDAAELVDVADRALYLAKDLGRDQVRAAE